MPEKFWRSNGSVTRNILGQTLIMSTSPKEAPEGTPSRRKVEDSCEVIYAKQSVSWGSWTPSEALWLECLSPRVCVAAAMCRRQRQRAWAVLRARSAVRLLRSGA